VPGACGNRKRPGAIRIRYSKRKPTFSCIEEANEHDN
jgi:hypothetical protein